MKQLYERFFRIPEKGHVRENVVLMRIGISLALSVVCLLMMCFSAYAYFSATMALDMGTVQAARFDLDVTTVPGGLPTVSLPAETLNTYESYYVLDNTAGVDSQTYTFTLTKAGTATVGYAKLAVKLEGTNDPQDPADVQSYFTLPIGTYLADDGTETTELVRTVQITLEAGQKAWVRVLPRWGSCALQPIVDGQLIVPTILVEGPDESTTTTTTTTSVTTTTTETADTATTTGGAEGTDTTTVAAGATTVTPENTATTEIATTTVPETAVSTTVTDESVDTE